MGKRVIRPIATSKPLNRSLQKAAHVITSWISTDVFWHYLGAIFADQREIWNRDEGSHADIGHVTKTAISKIQDGGQLPF